MWHAIGSTTVISFNTSTQYWSLACMAAEARKMDRHISAIEYQLQGTMATMTPCDQSQLVRAVTPEPNTMQKRSIRISHEDCLAAIEASPDLSTCTKAKYNNNNCYWACHSHVAIDPAPTTSQLGH
jgi:hypothetical protein